MGDVLHRLTDTVATWDASRAAEKTACADALATLARNMEAAIALWRECADSTDPVENRFTAVITFGAQRAKALHKLHLDQKAAAAALTEASGVAFADTLGIVEDVDIVQAYGQFGPGESLGARAGQAIAKLEERRRALEEAVTRL